MLSNARLLAAVASTTSTSDSPTSTSNPAIPIPIPPTDLKRCRLLGPTALIVQGLMGILVILSLIWKRNHESPRRPWRIWCVLHYRLLRRANAKAGSLMFPNKSLDRYSFIFPMSLSPPWWLTTVQTIRAHYIF